GLRQRVSPASLNAGDNASVNSIDIQKRYGIELAAYASHEWKPSNWLSLIYGLRLTDFMVQGPGTYYTFDEDGEAIDSKDYDGRIVKHHLNLEPRVSMSFI